MAPAMFERLVENIRRTGRLESTPYCAQVKGLGAVEVVSGHHRIRAARKAGLTHVDVLVDTSDLTRSQIVAKQLAHNALVGHDDNDLIRQLVGRLTSVDDLLESGLGEDFVPTPEKFKVTLFTPHADYKWKTATFTFLDHQLASFEALAKSLKSEARTVCVGCQDQFEPFIKAVAAFGRERNIVSAATAIAVLTELATAEAAELKAQREAAEEDAGPGKSPTIKTGPLLSQLFGTARVPPDVAGVIREALDKMTANQDVPAGTKWQALERWAADYLAGA
ncbi:MAG TPA: ParB N-terminal domain-containing protein, partial [Mycobacterium sp.]|nr:ParB N-terminal domain-containing protein [Mycobacterium sp.]